MSKRKDSGADAVDLSSIASFPASDPPGWILPSSDRADPGSSDPSAVVRRMFDAFRRGDVNRLLETVHPNSRWTYFGADPRPRHARMQGHDEVRRFFERILSRLDMRSFEPTEFVAQDSTVVVFGSEEGVVRKTGEPFRNEWVQKYVVTRGLITEMVEFNTVVQPSSDR